MADVIAPEFKRFVTAERRASRLSAAPGPMAAGEVSDPVFIQDKQASELLRVAAKRANGLFHPTRRTEVVWVEGDSELAINLVDLNVKRADGLIRVVIPVRCDQTGNAQVEVVFAVGSPDQPAGPGWSFVGTTDATRRQTLAGQTLDPTHSGVVTFDLATGTLANNRVILLVAVIRAGTSPADDIPLTAKTLEELAMTSPNVAIRSVRIVS